MKNQRIEADIPPVFLHLTKDHKDRGRVFKQYVLSYLEVAYPEYRLVKISGMKAICEKRGDFE